MARLMRHPLDAIPADRRGAALRWLTAATLVVGVAMGLLDQQLKTPAVPLDWRMPNFARRARVSSPGIPGLRSVMAKRPLSAAAGAAAGACGRRAWKGWSKRRV